MSEPLLVFRGIEKTFAETNILRNVDISLYPGKCILLSGNNGSGKTTLLKIIADLKLLLVQKLNYPENLTAGKTQFGAFVEK